MIFTSNHFIDVVELIEVEEDSWEVSNEEHADNDQQDQGKVKIFGLLQIEMILVFEYDMTITTLCAEFDNQAPKIEQCEKQNLKY